MSGAKPTQPTTEEASLLTFVKGDRLPCPLFRGDCVDPIGPVRSFNSKETRPAKGDGAGDMALDRSRHRLFVGTRVPPEMTVYNSLSGKEIQSLPGPETMDGVYYDANLKRVYMTGGRWYGMPDASPGWIYVYQQKDPDHYDVISKVKTRPGSGTSLLVTQFNRFYVASQAIGDQEAAILVFEPVQ